MELSAGACNTSSLWPHEELHHIEYWAGQSCFRNAAIFAARKIIFVVFAIITV